jgi:hypothetical protein
MTVTATTSTRSYTGDGSTTSFPTTFAFQGTGSAAELTVVQRTIATGAETTLSYSTHFTVTGGDGSTGTVVAASAPADTVQWHIRRNTSTLQNSNYVTNDPFPADTLEGDIDRLSMAGQERDGDISQGFKYPDTYTGGASNLVPEPSANKVLQWNSSANALANGSEVALPASLTASNFIQVNAGATNYDMKTAAQVFTALLATEGNGMIAHAGSGSAEPRTITGTSNQITLTNGDGVRATQPCSIPDAITFTGKTVTGGTYSSIVATSTMAGDPTSAMHIATKQYTDAVAAGLSKRATVHLATTGAITISSALKSDASPTPTIDGVAIQAGDLVLVKDQGSSDREQNGIYVCGSTPARDDLFDTYDEHPGTLVAVEEGGDKRRQDVSLHKQPWGHTKHNRYSLD